MSSDGPNIVTPTGFPESRYLVISLTIMFCLSAHCHLLQAVYNIYRQQT